MSDEELSGPYEAIEKLTKDLKNASYRLERREARYLVDFYYQIQEFRKTASNQAKVQAGNEPNQLVSWTSENMRRFENNIKKSLGYFAEAYTVGAWMRSLCGIGEVISAGFLASVDIRFCHTAGAVWRFAGLDPSNQWHSREDANQMIADAYPGKKFFTREEALKVFADLGRPHTLIVDSVLFVKDRKRVKAEDVAAAVARKPWNSKLKVLCWKLGESFIKQQNRPKDYYGAIYVDRKEYETIRNESGGNRDVAAREMQRYKYGKDTDAYYWVNGCMTPAQSQLLRTEVPAAEQLGWAKRNAGALGSGTPMLPPGQIHSRARRYAVKLFLSHLQAVMYQDYYGKPGPKPWIFSDPKHTHYKDPPNWPFAGGGKSLKDLLDVVEPVPVEDAGPADEIDAME